MKKNVSFLLIGYGCLVAVLGLLTQQLAPDLARPCLLAGLVGGSLSVLWGLLALAGKPSRGWAIFTMATTGFVLLSQVVTHWMQSGEPTPDTRALALVATVMFLATFGTLMTVTHLGIPDRATGDDESGKGGDSSGGKPPGSGTPDAWKEARRQRRPGPEAKP